MDRATMLNNRRTPLAWMNLVHQWRRLLVAVGGIGFAVVLMFMQLGFRNALFDSTVGLHHSLNADLVITSAARYSLSVKETFSRRRLLQALGCAGVRSARPLYIETAQSIWKNPGTGQGYPIRVLAFDPRHSVLALPGVSDGGEALLLPDTVLFDRRSKSDYGAPRVGDRVELSDRATRIAGLFSLGTDFANDGNAIMSAENYRAYFGRPGTGHDPLAEVDVGLIVLEPGTDPAAVLAAIREALPDDVQIQTKDQLIARELAFWRDSTPIGFIFGLGTVMGFIVGVVICYQILYSDVDDHLAEFATLKAMGYQNRYFVGLVFQESILLSAFGFLPGIVVSGLLYLALSWATGLLLDLTTARAAGVLVLTLAMCITSGCLALRRVFQADPAELF